MRGVLAQARIELVLTFRRGESLLVVTGIPVGILVFFSIVDILPRDHPSAVGFLLPGVLSLSIIASGMTSLGIATGFERRAGVLLRLGTTPLGRSGLLLAKVIALCVTVTGQVLVVGIFAVVMGWEPAASVALLPVVILGTYCMATLGLLNAGRLRAETNLAVANLLFLLFLFLGGVVVSTDQLPDTLAAVARLLPAEPLTAGIRAALDGGNVALRTWVSLGTWSVIFTVGVRRGFRWR